MTAESFLGSLSENIESNLRLAEELNKMAEESMKTPICGECGEELTELEIKERKDSGINIFDKDTICDDCFSDFINRGGIK